MELLVDMFHRGNKADIMWFLGGAWLLVLFLGLIATKIWKKIRRSKHLSS